ncbi:MAG TPA: HAMP domain-containing sensor histidine kinase, partial [Oscillatoriaceae cyanobacterium]
RRAAELGLGLIDKGTGPETRSWALGLLAEALIWQEELDAAERTLARLREGATGEPPRARRLAGWIAWRRGDLEAAQKTWSEALASARAQGLQQLEVRLLLDLHLAERQSGRVGDGAELASAYAVAEKQRSPESLALCCLGLALVYMESGQELLAERLSRRGHELLGQLTQALGSPAARQAFSLHPARHPFCEMRGPEEVQRLVHKSRRLEMLLTLGHTLGTTHDVDAVLKQVRSFTLELTQAERCLILLQHGRELRQFGVVEGYSRTIVERVLATREPACVLDTFSDAQLKAQASIQDLQVRSVMCVPLLVGANLLGALYVDSRVALGTFTAEDLRMLGAIAAQAAVALDGARLHHALQQELQRKQAYIQRLENSENVIRHLQDLDRVRAEYFQAASHDLRGPLASIQVSCQALLKGLMEPLNDDQASAISGIQHASRSLMGLIDGILDSAQLEAGKLVLNPRPVALAKPVRDAVRMLAALAADRGLSLDWDEAAFTALPAVSGDERRIEQIVLNLLTNAIKFTRQGGVRLHAELAGPGVSLAIADTGPGLPPERQANPFERYAAGTSAASGNGLGLWFVKGLVELHHGRIAVESTPAGTTFRIWLPLAS